MSARHVIVPLRPGSDGDASHRPTFPAPIELDPPILYLEKVGTQWMKARGEARPGVTYTLEKLPTGYACFQRARPGNPKQVDKYLYGHPSHKTFDSPNRFFPHFQYLMDNGGNSIGCPCTVCNPRGGVLPKGEYLSSHFSSSSSGRSSFASTPRIVQPAPTPAPVPVSMPLSASASASTLQVKGRPKTSSTGQDTSRVDEEGTPDVYRNLIDKLKRHGTIDEAIQEPLSLDWRAEQEILPRILQKLKDDPQWVPRTGDVVIYVRDLPPDIKVRRDQETGQYMMWNKEQEMFSGNLIWEAGLVGQPPVEDVHLEDIVQEGQKEMSVAYSGIRVEPLPNPNDVDKSLSKKYKYMPIHHTRPFIFWRELLSGVSEETWHPTIRNALTLMSTLSLMGKSRFRGTWPNAQIFCHGLYVSSEMLTIGDTVRLLPKPEQNSCCDILSIKSIRLKLSNLDKASSNDYDEGRPYNSEVWIYGAAYTMDPSRSNKQWVGDTITAPKASEQYATWHPLHPPSKELAIPFSRVVGRLYEHDALSLWLDSEVLATPDTGREGVLESRAFARENDKRIADVYDATWYWADSRAEALDLHTVNGLEVGNHDLERDPKEWRKQIKILEGVEGSQAKSDTSKSAFGGSQGLRSFMVSATATLPVRTQTMSTSEDESMNGSGTGESSSSDRKQGIIDDPSEDDDNIRQQMRIIEDQPQATYHPKKKAKVMVIVDNPSKS